MQCPHCESRDVMLCSVAHAQGTTSMTVSGGRHEGSYTATGQTGFARSCAPPTSSFFFLLGGVVFVGFWAAVMYMFLPNTGRPGYVMDGADTFITWLFNGFAALTLLMAVLALVSFFRRPKNRAALERWHRTWICTRCGRFFVPDR